MRYMILAFKHDDEFELFPDDLELMLTGHSNPPFSVEVIGEVPEHVVDLYRAAPVEQ